MDYKVIKSKIGTSEVSKFSNFSLPSQITDTSFLKGVGILFLTKESSSIGLINLKGEINEEWLGKKYGSNIVNGDSNVSRFSDPISICTNDKYGFIIEGNGLRIRKFYLKTREVRTLTGSQYIESIGKYLPTGDTLIKSCANNTSLFFTSVLSNRIFKVTGNSLEGVIGDGKARFSVSSQYNMSSFSRPSGIVVNGKNIYVSDTGNKCIRSINFKEKVIRVVSGSPSDNMKSVFNAPSKLLVNKGMIVVLDGGEVKVVNLSGEGITSVFKSESIDSIEVDSQRNIFILENHAG